MFITDFPKLYEMVGAHPTLAQTVRFSQSGLCPTEMGKAFDVIYDRFKRYRTFTDEEEEFFEALQQRLNRWYGKYKPIFDVINSINGYTKKTEWDIDRLTESNNNVESTNDSTDKLTSIGNSTSTSASETTYNGSEKTVNQPIGRHTLTKEYGNGVNSTVLGEDDTALGATDSYTYGQDVTETGFNNRFDDSASTSVNKDTQSNTSVANSNHKSDSNTKGKTDIDQDILTTDTEKTLAMMYKRYGINSFGEELLELVSDLFLGVY